MKDAHQKIAIIMRGVAGSGKTTEARKLRGEHGIIHSTDTYFTNKGRYQFLPQMLSDYHEKNYRAFCISLANSMPVVICDNTNSRIIHFIHYIEAAEAAGYAVRIVEMQHPDPEVAAARNLHYVPADKIKMMIENWEIYPRPVE